MLNQLSTLKNVVKSFVQEEDGLAATEYAVLFIVILAFILAGAALLGPQIQAAFERAASALP